MNNNALSVEKRNGYAVVTISRPAVLNALCRAVLLELDEVMAKLNEDRDCNAVILTGSGKAFVAGADIAEMAEITGIEARDWSLLGQAVYSRIEGFRSPVIAAINGFALGAGCELAMACDIRVASAKAKFSQPEVNLGITPGWAGTQRLSRLVGKGMAKLLIFTGDIIDAGEALRIGLVDKVVEPEELMATAEAIAVKILAMSPLAVAQSKMLINKGLEMTTEGGSALEAEAFGICFASPDQREGMKAFVEKRKPVFSRGR